MQMRRKQAKNALFWYIMLEKERLFHKEVIGRPKFFFCRLDAKVSNKSPWHFIVEKYPKQYERKSI